VGGLIKTNDYFETTLSQGQNGQHPENGLGFQACIKTPLMYHFRRLIF